MNNSLQEHRVLVTRPAHQAEHLVHLLERQGKQVIRLPTLAIAAIEDKSTIQRTLASLDKFQWLVFVSTNAVNFAVHANNGKMSEFSAAVAAIGKATAAALLQHGLKVDLIPQSPYNSQALLATEAMQQIGQQKFLIVRGEGGLEELADGLRDRGAQVEYLDVYRRIVPDIDCSEVNSLLSENKLDVITATSGEALQNLFFMVASENQHRLLARPLIVISERIRQIAKNIGFKCIAVTGDPSDEAIVEVVINITGEIKSGRID